jgi:hypothetical protein
MGEFKVPSGGKGHIGHILKFLEESCSASKRYDLCLPGVKPGKNPGYPLTFQLQPGNAGF